MPPSGDGEGRHLWQSFTPENSPWESSYDGNDPLAGRRFGATLPVPAWYPADGNRNYADGRLRNASVEITHWTTTLSGNPALDLVSNPRAVTLGTGLRSYALPVRCIRE